MSRILSVTTFKNILPPLALIINNYWDILKVSPKLKDIFR